METTGRLQVGIDIGKSKADYALLHSNGRVVELHRSFANSRVGFEQAKGMLLKQLQGGSFEGVDLAVEATSYYWLPLYVQISEDQDLARYHPRLALLNAGWVKWYKKSFAPDHKSDRRDPYYIAERLRTLPNPVWWRYEPHWLVLRLRTRLRFHLSQDLIREKTHYQLFLFLAYSSYTQAKPFSDPFGQLSQSLLNDPALLEELAKLPLEALVARLDELSQHHLKDPLGNATRLRQALDESFRLPPDLDPPIRAALHRLSTMIRNLEEYIHCLDEEITALVQHDYPEVAWLDSIPGVGLVFASGIAAEIGDLQRFTSQLRWDDHRNCYRHRTSREVEDAVAKFAGLWWPENSSGQFTAEETPLSKRGNAYLRFYTLLAADRMRLSIPAYSRFYAKKYAQATKHQYKRALVLTGRKALGLFVGLLHHHEPYRPEEGA